MSDVVIRTPETTDIEAGTYNIVMEAESVEIVDAASNAKAAEGRRHAKQMIKLIEQEFKESIGSAFKAHRSLTAMQKKWLEGPREAVKIYDRKLLGHQQAKQQARLAEQERLREQARKEAEAKQLAEAEALELAGETEAAEQVLEAPTIVNVPVVADEEPQAKGVSYRTTWKHRIVNADAIPRQYMIPNDKALAAHARSMGAAAKIEGVEFYEHKTVAGTGY